MKLYLYDIESMPHTVRCWGLFSQFISVNQIVEPGRVACWAGKWLGEKSIEFRSEHADGHEAMIRRLHEELSEADGVITYNGASFDAKMINVEFIHYGLTPLPPTKQIDLYKVVKKNFRFPSNKLEYVSKALGIGEKVKHQGFDLWTQCMAGDEKAWLTMKKYNIVDTKLLEDLYHKLLPWIQHHPSHSLDKEARVCPNCGSKHLQQRGYSLTKTSRFARICCQSCGTWSRERINEVAPDNRKNIVISI